MVTRLCGVRHEEVEGGGMEWQRLAGGGGRNIFRWRRRNRGEEKGEMCGRWGLETNISSHIIDVHVDFEELARATMEKLDRIWVDLVRKEIKSLLDIIDAAEHRIEIDSFASITNPHATYNMDKVRVDFVWFDQNANKLYYFLHDKHGEKITAEVPLNLVASYKEKDFSQTFVSINNFQVRGSEIKFVFIHTLRKVAIRIAKVIQQQGTIYLTHVMLVHTKSGNLLVDTELTGVEFDPAFHKISTTIYIQPNQTFQHPPTMVNTDSLKEFENNNTINDCDTNEQADVAVENTNMNNSDDDVGIDIQHSESVSDEEIDEEDDLEDFINDDDADDEDDNIDDEYTNDDFLLSKHYLAHNMKVFTLGLCLPFSLLIYATTFFCPNVGGFTITFLF
nr:hypothetical protein [Tanacetum cinerariifolium]